MIDPEARRSSFVIVVGGHSRNIGKTSVAAGLIAAFPQLGWTAMKITQFGRGICSMNGRQCSCAIDEHAYAIMEESNREGRTDTSRFLLAGARRSLWVRTKQGRLDLAMPKLQMLLRTEPFVMIESNSILRFISPDLYVVVLKPGVEDFKESAREFLGKADASGCGGSQRACAALAGSARGTFEPATDVSGCPSEILLAGTERLRPVAAQDGSEPSAMTRVPWNGLRFMAGS